MNVIRNSLKRPVKRDELEQLWIKQADAAAESQRWDLTQNAFRQARLKTGEWTDKLQSLAVRRQSQWTYRRYWHHQNKSAAITVK
jgi:phosphatidylinositol kinase/protein kinase (PI-3  family)